MIAAFTMC